MMSRAKKNIDNNTKIAEDLRRVTREFVVKIKNYKS